MNASLTEAQLKALIRVSTGELRHDFLGACPDEIEGFDARDSECDACLAIMDTE